MEGKAMVVNKFRELRACTVLLIADEAGMSTVE